MDSAKLYNATTAAVRKDFPSRQHASLRRCPPRPVPRTIGVHTQTPLTISRMFQSQQEEKFYHDFCFISFCPTGAFPNQGQPIHFNFIQNKCLDVQGGVLADGTPVQM